MYNIYIVAKKDLFRKEKKEMNVIFENNTVVIKNSDDFSPELMFECGQAFRWRKTEESSYLGIVNETPLKVEKTRDGIVLKCKSAEDFSKVWSNYFQLSKDYGEIRKKLSEMEKLAPAIEYGKGIRILKQDFWEALCSFIISQCNNIPRIKGIIEKLCVNFGEVSEFDGEVLYTFPKPETIAALSVEELGIIRAGYRAEYLINAANAVVSGELSEDLLCKMDTESARKELMKLKVWEEKLRIVCCYMD